MAGYVLSHSEHIAMDRIVRIRYKCKNVRRKLVVPLVALGQAFQ